MADIQLKYKILVAGAKNTGKTSFVKYITGKKFNQNQQPSMQVKVSSIIKNELDLDIWDCPSLEDTMMEHVFLLGTDAYIIFIDDNGEWQKVIENIKRISHKPGILIIFVRNKSDEPQKDISIPIPYIPISAKTGERCEEIIDNLISHWTFTAIKSAGKR